MRIKYKILKICIVIISIIGFLWSPSFFGQPECNDQIITNDGPNIDVEGDCRSWNNWDWIEFELFHWWNAVYEILNIEETAVTPTPFMKVSDTVKECMKNSLEWVDHPNKSGEKIMSLDKMAKCVKP